MGATVSVRSHMSREPRGTSGYALSRPLKLIRIIARLNVGGPARHVAVLSREMERARFSTVLVTGRPARQEGDLAHLIPTTVRHLVIPQLGRAIQPLRDAFAFARLCRLLWRERPDILHTHTAKAGTLGRLAGMCFRLTQRLRGRRERLIMVHTFHGHVLSGYFGWLLSAVFIRIERWLARHTDALIAVSPSVRDDLLRLRVADLVRVRVIPLGLDLSCLLGVDPAIGPPRGVEEGAAGLPVSLHGREPGWRRATGIPAEARLVGIVGRLVPIKQHGLFLRAARQLADRHPELHFAVIGDGPCRGQLEAMARALRLERVVHFLGWQLDLPSVYASLDCVCLTSRNEGTPVSIIEAMAAGRPVVATAVGGVVDLLGGMQESREDYHIAQRGLLVQLADAPAGIGHAIERVFADEPLRERLTRAAKAYVSEQLTAERLVRDVTGLYEALCAGGDGQDGA